MRVAIILLKWEHILLGSRARRFEEVANFQISLAFIVSIAKQMQTCACSYAVRPLPFLEYL